MHCPGCIGASSFASLRMTRLPPITTSEARDDNLGFDRPVAILPQLG